MRRALDATDDARASLRRLRTELSVDALADGSASDELRRLRRQLTDLRHDARSPVLAPLRIVPGVSRQVRAVDALSGAGIDGASIGLELLDHIEATLDRPLPTGEARLGFLRSIEGPVTEARRQLDDVTLGPDGPLLPALADARATAEEGLGDLAVYLDGATNVLRSLHDILDGGQYLVLAANNAEMRSGSGMFLQAGMLRSGGGDIGVDDLVPAESIVLPRGAVDPGGPTYGDMWAFLEPTVEWRNLAASPRFEVTAELAARMWERLGNPRPEGVVAVDPFALAAVLRATGPVVLDDMTIGADQVVPFLLHDQYDVFEGSGSDVAAQDERRDRLGRLIDAAFEALGSGRVDPIDLVEGLRDAVRGRHLLAWSSEPAAQSGWQAAGMAGDLEVDSVMVSLLNRGVNKLDPFVTVAAHLDVAPATSGTRAGTLEVRVTNHAPDGEVPYVAGPARGVTDRYGQYAGILSVSLPGVARDARVEGVSDLEVAGPDGPVLALGTKFVVDQGQTRDFVIRFEVPEELTSVRIEPDARPWPVEWSVGSRSFSDGQHHRVAIDRSGP